MISTSPGDRIARTIGAAGSVKLRAEIRPLQAKNARFR
jgi:hypothetical protein